jgi:transposase
MEKIEQFLYQKQTVHWQRLHNPQFLTHSNQKIVNWQEIEGFEPLIPQWTWYCGVEVHKKHIVWAFYGHDLNQRVEGPILRCANTYVALTAFLKVIQKFNPKRFLMETTGIFHFFIAWELLAAFKGSDITVMNSMLIHRFVASVRKSDRSDACKLAMIAQFDELIRYSYVPSKDQAVLRELTRLRSNYVKETTKIKNRIKKILSMFGFHWEFSYDFKGGVAFLLGFLKYSQSLGDFLTLCGHTTAYSYMKKYFTELYEYAFFNPTEELRELLRFSFHSLAVHIQEIHLIEKQIYQTMEKLDSFKQAVLLLDVIPGMQTMSKISFIAEVGNIHRFPTAGDLLVYAGIAPRGGSSGITDLNDPKEKVVAKDHPNRKCNRVLKMILVRAAGTIFRMCESRKTADDICRYATRFDGSSKQYFKHAFKVAAKLGRKLYYCLDRQIGYDPLYGLQNDPVGKRKNRSYRKRKQSRELYSRNHILNQNVEEIYGILEKMGVGSQVIQKCRDILQISPKKEGVSHG